MGEAGARLLTAQDDAALARLIASGDRAAFESLMRLYNRRLYRLARASLGDDAEAKDALQDAYLRAYRSIGQYRGGAALGTWLSRIVLNECLARQRRAARRNNIVSIVSWEASIACCRRGRRGRATGRRICPRANAQRARAQGERVA